MLAGLRARDEPLASQRAVLLGAGAAGTGIARLLGLAIRQAGADPRTLRRRIVLLDSRGLLFEGRVPLHEDQREFALCPDDMEALGFPPADRHDFEAVVRHMRPTILVGTSGAPGAFT